MSDYKLEVRIKNGKFSKMMESFGIKTVTELSRKSNISVQALYSIANLQLDPYVRVRDINFGTRIIEGHYKKAYKELSDFFCVSPLDLWPESLEESLKKSVTTKYFDLKDLPQLGTIVDHKQLPDPEEYTDKKFQNEIIEQNVTQSNTIVTMITSSEGPVPFRFSSKGTYNIRGQSPFGYNKTFVGEQKN